MGCKNEMVSKILKQWHKEKEKKMNSWHPIVDDILEIEDLNEKRLDTSHNFLLRFT